MRARRRLDEDAVLRRREAGAFDDIAVRHGTSEHRAEALGAGEAAAFEVDVPAGGSGFAETHVKLPDPFGVLHTGVGSAVGVMHRSGEGVRNRPTRKQRSR